MATQSCAKSIVQAMEDFNQHMLSCLYISMQQKIVMFIYFTATPKILPYGVALQRSSVAVWRRWWHRKGGTQHIFGWGGAPVTQILTLFKNKLNKFSLPIFDTQLGTFNLKTCFRQENNCSCLGDSWLRLRQKSLKAILAHPVKAT